MSAVQPSSEPPFLGGISAELSIPDIDGDGSPGELEAVTCYPSAFDDLSSRLGSDDMPISIIQNDLPDSPTSLPQVKHRRVLFPLYDECL